MKKKMTKDDLVWRLKELPTAEGVAALVEQKVLTTAEAREILLSPRKQEDDPEKVKLLQEQIDFLKTVIEALKQPSATTIYYPRWVDTRPWFGPIWSSVTTGTTLKATPMTGNVINTASLSSGTASAGYRIQ